MVISFLLCCNARRCRVPRVLKTKKPRAFSSARGFELLVLGIKGSAHHRQAGIKIPEVKIKSACTVGCHHFFNYLLSLKTHSI